MKYLGPVVAVMAALAFLLALFFEARDHGMTTHAWMYLGLVGLSLPAGIASARDLTTRDGRIGV